MFLEIGQTIPALTLPDQNGTEKSLNALARNKGCIYYFYPKDSTPGCTLEAQDCQQLRPEFHAKGYEVVGISKDSVKSHLSFCQKQGLQFILLSDTKGEACEGFGVWQEKIRCGKASMGIVRSTFVTDPTGKVVKVYPNVTAKGHAAQVLNDLAG
ncbi:MAG: peroxiredoxin [Magnetococcales bacterium]|nr:peroxiredoxin [Magnetococcales bacterium]NGZ29034.1 peroxiredoxin [Magnetococcales bacterium]